MATTLSRQQASGPNFDKRKGPTTAVGPALPSPLTEDVMAAALKELPDGTKRATEACLKCFRVRCATKKDSCGFRTSSRAQTRRTNFAGGIHGNRGAPLANILPIPSDGFSPESPRSASSRHATCSPTFRASAPSLRLCPL